MQKPCSWLNVVIFVRSKNDGDVRLDFSREVKQATKTLLRCHQVREEVSPAKKKTDYTGLIQLYFWISCFWDVSSSSTLLTNRIRNRCKWFFIGSRFFGSRVELSLVCLHEKQYENSKLHSIYRGDEKVNWVAMSFRPLTKLYYIFSAGRV